MFLELHFTHRGPMPSTGWPGTASARHDQGPRTNVPLNVPCASSEHCFGKFLPESPPQQAEAPDHPGSGTAGARALKTLPLSAPRQDRSAVMSLPSHRPWSPTPRPQSKASPLPVLSLLKDQRHGGRCPRSTRLLFACRSPSCAQS